MIIRAGFEPTALTISTTRFAATQLDIVAPRQSLSWTTLTIQSLALTLAGAGDIDTEAPVGSAFPIQRAGPSVVMFAVAGGAFAAHTLV